MSQIRARVLRTGLRVHTTLKNLPLYRKGYAAMKYRFTGQTYRQDLHARIFCSHYEDSAIREDLILYESFHGSSIACSPAALFRFALGDERLKGRTHIWALDDAEAIPADLADRNDVRFVRRSDERYPRYLATAKILINNSTFPPWFVRREGQVYLNTWHGIPLKRMFRHENGAPARFANSQRNFLQASHITLAGEYAVEKLLGAADVEPLCRGRTYLPGTPRIDLTVATRAAWSPSDGERHILFAPTWKGVIGEAESQIDEIRAFIAALDGLPGPRTVLHIKAHNFNTDDLSALPTGQGTLAVQTVPKGEDINAVMARMDMVVTDYSSLVFDALAANIPSALFVPDLETYRRERGLYIDLETLPLAVCHGARDLQRAIETARRPSDYPADLYDAARAAHFAQEDGDASRRVWDSLLGVADAVQPLEGSDKPLIAMFAGGFKRNGITSSALNLLSNIDRDRYDVAVLTDGSRLLEESWDAIARIPDGVMLLHRVGREGFTAEEHQAKEHYYAANGLDDGHELAMMKRAMTREARRLIGDLRVDTAIEFSAYRRMWPWIFAMMNARRRVIYQHNDMKSERDQRFDVLQGVFFLYRFYDEVVSVSEVTRALNERNLKRYYHDARSRTVRNTLDLDAIATRSAPPAHPDPNLPAVGADTIDFVTMGRFSAEKNHAMLLEAFRILHASEPTARLTILGEGPLWVQTIALRDRMGLRDLVHIPGYSDQALAFLARCDCFVLPSLYEGQPMVILEALALGKPVIATDIAGSRGALAGGYGYLAKGTDAAAFAQAMQDYCDGLIRFKPFDAQAYNERARADFEALLQGKEGDAP